MALTTISTLQNIFRYKANGIGFSFYYSGTNTFYENLGGYKVLELKTNGTLSLSLINKTINYFIIGGGGQGGRGRTSPNSNLCYGGNAGNSGVLLTGTFTHNGNFNYTIVIGNGGSGATSANNGNSGGLSSLEGNSQNISASGGLGGFGNFTSRTPNTIVSNSNQGGSGGNDNTISAQTAGKGLDGTIFQPNGVKYGVSGSGGNRTGTQVEPFLNGGKGGNNNSGGGVTGPGTAGLNYGSSGGGGGSSINTYGYGGNGFEGVVFLYWT